MPDALLDALRTRLQGPDPTLAQDLEAAVLARKDERAGHTDWGLLCEEAGLFNLAFREFQLALRDQADDTVAAFRLAHHYRERGDATRALDLLERLLTREPAQEEWLALYIDLLREEGAEPRIRAALRKALCAGLP